jgi:hypothetical protein
LDDLRGKRELEKLGALEFEVEKFESRIGYQDRLYIWQKYAGVDVEESKVGHNQVANQ